MGERPRRLFKNDVMLQRSVSFCGRFVAVLAYDEYGFSVGKIRRDRQSGLEDMRKG